MEIPSPAEPEWSLRLLVTPSEQHAWFRARAAPGLTVRGLNIREGGGSQTESSCRTATVFPFRDAKKSQMIYELKRITPPTGEASQEDRCAKEKHLSHVT